MSERKLSVYANDVTDWFVAYDEQDAKELCIKHYESVDDGEHEFTRVPDDKVLACDTGETEPWRPPPEHSGLSSEMFEQPAHQPKRTVPVIVRKTAAEWAATSPRGFLMSTEY